MTTPPRRAPEVHIALTPRCGQRTMIAVGPAHGTAARRASPPTERLDQTRMMPRVPVGARIRRPHHALARRCCARRHDLSAERRRAGSWARPGKHHRAGRSARLAQPRAPLLHQGALDRARRGQHQRHLRQRAHGLAARPQERRPPLARRPGAGLPPALGGCHELGRPALRWRASCCWRCCTYFLYVVVRALRQDLRAATRRATAHAAPPHRPRPACPSPASGLELLEAGQSAPAGRRALPAARSRW